MNDQTIFAIALIAILALGIATGFLFAWHAWGLPAARWNALNKSARIRILGGAGWQGDKGNYRLLGLEFYSTFHDVESVRPETEQARRMMRHYAEHMRRM